MQTASAGMNNDDVRTIKQLLNEQLIPRPNLSDNGLFDMQTYLAVIRFQTEKWLVVDGIVGAPTYNALFMTEKFVVYKPPSALVAQPTDDSCWAASTSMLLNMPITMVFFKAAAAGVKFPHGLTNDTGSNTPTNTTKFAQAFGLKLIPGQSWTSGGLANLLANHGPLMMDTLWKVDRYVDGKRANGHMRVIAGMRGTDDADESTILLYDPLDPGQGHIESMLYGPLMRQFPAATYQLYYR